MHGIQGGAHHTHARVREAAIYISNHTVREQDRGVIIVGGSIEMGDLTGQLMIAAPSTAVENMLSSLSVLLAISFGCLSG